MNCIINHVLVGAYKLEAVLLIVEEAYFVAYFVEEASFADQEVLVALVEAQDLEVAVVGLPFGLLPAFHFRFSSEPIARE